MKIKTRRYYLYYLAALGGFFIAILPLKIGLFLANIAGKIAFSLVAKQRNKTIENLRSAFGEKKDAEIKKIAEDVFINLCKNAVEIINFYKLTPKNLGMWITAEGAEKVKRAHARGKGLIVLAAHFGNWELMSVWFSFNGYPSTAIARRLYFDRYESFINKVRASKGINVIYRDGSVKEVLKRLRNNEAIGILADQDVDSIDGVFVNFFGKPAYTPKAPVALALASGAPLLPCFLLRQNGSHRLVIEDPVEIEEKSTKEETIRFNTEKWSRMVESYIKEYPGKWVWMHRRWKTRPEDKEK